MQEGATTQGAEGPLRRKPREGGGDIREIPVALIRRPLAGTRSNDPVKVQQLMESIAAIGLQVPVRCVSSQDHQGLPCGHEPHLLPHQHAYSSATASSASLLSPSPC